MSLVKRMNKHIASLCLCSTCQGSSCACQDGAFPWPWWPTSLCWVVSCWCLGWLTSAVTGRYFRLLSSAPCCWCCPTSGKEKTRAPAAPWPRLVLFKTLTFKRVLLNPTQDSSPAVKIYTLSIHCFYALDKTLLRQRCSHAWWNVINKEVEKALPLRTFSSSGFPAELNVTSFVNSFAVTSTVTAVSFIEAQAINTHVFPSIYSATKHSGPQHCC